MAVQTNRGIPLSAVNPKFLHTNSTSHTWPFSAIAELIDNAYDPDVSAKQFWIDKTVIREESCLIFMDNGGGMDKEKMFKMLSFGFSDKETVNGHVPVGLYGNGFKSGSMRLGKDAIVFSKSRESFCVGMLSQTYLQEMCAENVTVPIASFQRCGKSIVPDPKDAASLQDILRHSLFRTKEELLSELKAINSHYASESTGTKIIIWNLRKTSTGKSEFDFETDRYDIQIPLEVYESEKEKYKQPCRTFQSSPESDFSLRAYCSILYLKPKMQIIIRGQKVKTQLISKSLAHIAKDKYKPSFLNRESISIIFGYNTKSKEHYGVMMYHKNRLIKSYERVGCQNRANEKGVGVIAVIECNFLKPTHNKQDFDFTEEYRRTMNTLGLKLEEYWKAIRHKKGIDHSIPMEDMAKRPDQNWVQCDECLKWRKLPDGVDMNKLPVKWFCKMNPDPQFRRCEEKEEAEDSEDESSTSLKTYKQIERNLKKQQELKKMQEKHRNAVLAQQNVNQKMPMHHFHQAQSSPQSPGYWTGTSPSTSQCDNMPVISSVVSLSAPKRMKRSPSVSQNQGAKKARVLDDHGSKTPESPTTSSAASSDLRASPLLILDNSDSSTDESSVDDDIVIDEVHSTPRPKASTFDLSKVKTENKNSSSAQGLHMECSDHVPIETEETRNEASTSDAQTSMMTQTEPPSVKTEEEQLAQKQIEVKKEVLYGDENVMKLSTSELENRSLDQGELKESSRPNIGSHNGANSMGAVEERTIRVEQEGTSKAYTTSALSEIEIDLLTGSDAQKQQDNLLKLLEATAQERDGLREQLLEKGRQLSKAVVKKDHQSSQTDQTEDYKALYLQGQQSIQKLTEERDGFRLKEKVLLQIKDKKEEAPGAGLNAGGEGHPSTAEACEDADDEMALQIDFLLKELDKVNAKCTELENQLEIMKQEKSVYGQLKLEVAELRKQKEQWTSRNGERECLKDPRSDSVTTGSTSTAPNLVNGIKKEDGSKDKPTEGDNTVKLRLLRSNIARLLVEFVPALDPDQVNCDCDVIDEILNQVLQEIGPSESL